MCIDESFNDFDNYVTERQMKYGTLLAFSITNSCPLKCEHCIVDANSIDDELSAESLKKCLIDLSEYKLINQISVTGGEPFYVPNKLKIFSEFCQESNIELGVVTSAYWASDYEKAYEIISQYPGVTDYCISTDQYHLKYVPLINIKNAYLAAKASNKTVKIRISGETEDTVKTHEILKTVYDIVSDQKEVTFQRIIPFGRAKENCKEHLKFVDEPFALPCCTNAPVVTERGIVEPCCGGIISLKGNHPLVLGDVKIDDLSTILNRSKSKWLLNYIRLWGFTELINEIENSDLKNKLPKSYLENDVCTTCCQLFADQEISDFLNELSQSLEFKLKVAYGMMHYYGDEKPIQIISEAYNLN